MIFDAYWSEVTLTGSGNIVSFVALTALGVPPLTAQIANQAAAPASFLSAWRSRDGHQATWPMRLVAVAGVAVGTVALVRTPASWVAHVAPAGVACSALLLFLAPWAQHWTTRYRLPLLAGAGLYGGTVGAGVGTVVLACVDAEGKSAAATRNALCLPMGLVAAAVLVATNPHSGLIHWPLAAALVAGQALGGEVGNRWLQRYLAATPAAPARFRAAVVALSVAAAAGMAGHSLAVFTIVLVLAVASYWVVGQVRQHRPPGLGIGSAKGVPT